MEEKKKFNINPLQGNKDDKGGKPKFNIYWVYGILAVSFILINIIFSGSDTSKIDWLKFEKMVKDHDVEAIVVVNKEVAHSSI